MRKKRISKVFIRSVMNLCELAKTTVGVDFALSVEFEFKVTLSQGFFLSRFFF